MKPITRSGAAAPAADAPEENVYPPELLADDEPRYLRRQKPVEIRRRKFDRRSWTLYGRVLQLSVMVLAAGAFLYYAARFFLFSPQVLLSKPDQIEVAGAHVVGRESIVSVFYGDRGRSVLRIPLEERRRALEELPWVEQVSDQRILPNRLRVEITERTPIAFLRSGLELLLIDARGVILERPASSGLGPAGQEFQFPVVTGVPESLSRAEREHRMQGYQEFLKGIELVKPRSSENVSEVDLSNPKDLLVVMTGLGGPGADSQAVTIHFGQNDFTGKYRMLVENFAHWQAGAGRVQSIDLQYTRQVVVNPESAAAANSGPAKPDSR